MAAGDYTLAYNGLTFGNGTTIGLLELVGWEDLPHIRSNDPDRPADDGTFDTPDFAGSRTITAKLLLYGPTFAADRALLRAATGVQRAALPLQVQLPGGVLERCMVKPRARSIPAAINYQFGYAEADLAWEASDPRIYVDSLSSLLCTMPTGAGGVTPPATPPVVLGATTGGQITATNTGDTAAPWTATIFGPVSNPTITNLNTGQSLSMTGTIAAGDYLVIDRATKLLLLNGTANRNLWLNQPGAAWFMLAPGSTVITLRASSGTGTMQFAFRSARM